MEPSFGKEVVRVKLDNSRTFFNFNVPCIDLANYRNNLYMFLISVSKHLHRQSTETSTCLDILNMAVCHCIFFFLKSNSFIVDH